MLVWRQQGSNVEPSVKRPANLTSALGQLASKTNGSKVPHRGPLHAAQRTAARSPKYSLALCAYEFVVHEGSRPRMQPIWMYAFGANHAEILRNLNAGGFFNIT